MTPEPNPSAGNQNDQRESRTINPSDRGAPSSQSKGQLPKGCLPGLAIVSIAILVLLGALGVVLYLKPTNLMRFGLVSNVQRMDSQLEKERTLPPEQYQELKVYLRSMRRFIENNEMDRANLSRLAPITKTFRAALQDGQIGRAELAAIRNTIWRSRIPLDVSGSPAPPAVPPNR